MITLSRLAKEGDADNFEEEEEAPDLVDEQVAKMSTGVRTLTLDKALLQNMSGPQLSEESVRSATKGAKRVDKVAPLHDPQ